MNQIPNFGQRLHFQLSDIRLLSNRMNQVPNFGRRLKLSTIETLSTNFGQCKMNKKYILPATVPIQTDHFQVSR